MIKDLNLENFDAFVKENSKCVIDFWAPWCGPCRMMGQVLDELSNEEGLVIGKVNCDLNEELCEKFGISSIPHLFIYENGKVKGDVLGYIGKDQLKL